MSYIYLPNYSENDLFTFYFRGELSEKELIDNLKRAK